MAETAGAHSVTWHRVWLWHVARKKIPAGDETGGWMRTNVGDHLLSPCGTTIGRLGLTAVFGMGTGVTPSVWSPTPI